MSAWWMLLLFSFVCPDGAVVDRVEGPRLAVLGNSGVRVVARAAVQSVRVREGDRLRVTPAGGCRAEAPSALDVARVRARLRALEARWRVSSGRVHRAQQ